VIEAEVKARVRHPQEVRAGLDRLATARVEVYQDVYADRDGVLAGADRELRVRTVHGPDSTRAVLTYKEPRVDRSGSKPEFETTVGDGAQVLEILGHLGYQPSLRFSKHCRNYDFQAHGRSMLATLVQVPELDGVFLEVETAAADQGELPDALAAVRAVLRDLGIGEEDETDELYTDAVAAYRSRPPAD
jgi:adenylate cyclase class 2